MNNLQWDQYVQTVSETVVVPQSRGNARIVPSMKKATVPVLNPLQSYKKQCIVIDEFIKHYKENEDEKLGR